MRTGLVAALAGVTLMLGVGASFADDGPLRPQDISGVQQQTYGSDLRIPAASDSGRGNTYEFQCSQAKMEPIPNNPHVLMFCDPGDR